MGDSRKGPDIMRKALKRKPARTAKKAKAKPTRMRTSAKGRIWTGTGLCSESQGDGVPCRGVDGECETCGKALPRPSESA